MKKYECVKPFVLEVYGDDGFPLEKEDFVVPEGSVWEVDETKYRFAGGPDSIRLTDEDGRWIEIYEDKLKNHFICLNTSISRSKK